MSLTTTMISAASKLATGALDKYEFIQKTGKSPEAALYESAQEVGECAELYLQGSLCENSDRYVKARETALYLAMYVRPKGQASHFIQESITGLFKFTLYSLKRKFIPDNYSSIPDFTDYSYYDRINTFIESIQRRDHVRISKYSKYPDISKDI